MKRLDVARHVTVALVAALCVTSAAAQTYPAKTVRIVVPQAPGGSTDTQARLVGKKLQESLGQNVLVDNRPGASTLIGTELVVRSPPDGYTFLCISGTLAASHAVNRKLSFDVVKDLAPVTQLSSAPQFLLVHRSVPARTVPELVALAKKNAGKLNAASSGNGSSNHLAIEMLKLAAGIDVQHIAYKGSGPATIALMSGEVDFSFAGSIVATPYIKGGKVRALAITSLTRSPAAPDVPPVASYYPGFEATNWFAIFAPGATPAPIINKMSTEVAAALKSAEVRDLFAKDGAEPVGSTPAELGAYFRREVERYAKLVRAANLRIE